MVHHLSFKTHSTASNFGWSEQDDCEVNLSKFHGHQSQLQRLISENMVILKTWQIVALDAYPLQIYHVCVCLLF